MSEEIQTLDPLSSALALSSPSAYAEVKARWKEFIDSGALPKHIETPQIAITIAGLGAEYGWGPMRSIRSIYLVNGQPSMSALAMRALVAERYPGGGIELVRNDKDGCTVKCRKTRDDKWLEISFTKEDAKAARLLGKSGPWQTYPPDMYYARATARACRWHFADAVCGVGVYLEAELANAKVTQVRKRIELPGDEPDALPEGDVIEVDHEPAEEQGEPPCEVCNQDVCTDGCPGVL